MAINLQKGQEISLEKEADGKISNISMGLGWDICELQAQKSGGIGGVLGSIFGGGSGKVKGKGDSIDLDASCVIFDADKKPIDAIFYDQLQSKDGSIVHTGDNLTGKGEGDDETINIDLAHVPSYAKSLVFTVNSFNGQSFATVENAYCRIVNAETDAEIARYDLSLQGSHTAMIMAKLYRDDGEWKMVAIGENASGKTFQDLMPAIIPHA